MDPISTDLLPIDPEPLLKELGAALPTPPQEAPAPGVVPTQPATPAQPPAPAAAPAPTAAVSAPSPDIGPTEGAPFNNAPPGSTPVITSAPLPPPEAPFDIYALQSQVNGQARGRHHIDKLDPDFRSALEQMLKDAPPEVRAAVRLNSGYRYAYRAQAKAEGVADWEATQDELRAKYEEAVARGERPAPVAAPEHSNHNRGRAFDLLYDGATRPSTPAGKAALEWVHANASRYGLQFPMSVEPWHIEPAWARGKGVVAPHNVVEAINYASKQTGVSPRLLQGIAQAESSFNTNKTNPDSTALGLFQQLDGTWNEDVGKWGWKYGIRAGTSRTDPTAAALMAAERVKLIQDATQKAVGRQPNEADIYAGWVLGQGGGPRFLKGLAEAPNAPAKDFADPKAVAANPWLFYEKGADGRPDYSRPWSNKSLYEVFAKKVSVDGTVSVDQTAVTGADVRSPLTVMAPPVFPPDKKYTDGAAAAIRAAKGEQEAGFWSTFYKSFTTREITARGVQALRDTGFVPDPDFNPTPEMIKAYATGLPNDMIADLGKAVSEQHMAVLAQRKRDELAFMRQVEGMGLKGTAALMLSAGLDPTSIAIGTLSGGLASSIGIAAKAGALGQRALQAGAGAVGNVAIEASIGALGGETSTQDFLTSAAVGAIFGGLFGPISRNPATANEAAGLAALAKSALNPDLSMEGPIPHLPAQFVGPETMQALMGSTAHGSLTLGMDPITWKMPTWAKAKKADAAKPAIDEITGKPVILPSEGQEPAFVSLPQSLGAARNPNAYPMFLTDPDFRGIKDATTPRSRLEWLPQWMRIGMGSQLHASDNAMTRTVAGAYAGSPVGMAADAVNPIGADVRQGRQFKRWLGAWYSALRPAFHEWQAERGMTSIADKALSRGWDDFNKEIVRYVRETDPTIIAQYPEAVRKAAQEFRNRTDEARRLMSEHRVAGAETLEQNVNYVPRVWSITAMDDAIIRLGGYSVVRDVIAAAIKNGSPHISDDLTIRMADAIMRSKSRRILGIDDDLDRLFSNADTATLADILRTNEHIRATEDEIRAILGELRHTEPSRPSYLKNRIRLNEKYVDQRTGLSIEDLLENHADRILADYMRKTTGRISLAQSRITHPVTGELILDGIRSQADHERLKRLVKQWAEEEDRAVPGTNILQQTERDITNIDALYKAIVGIPHDDQLTGWAEWLRALRTLNFPIQMGQLAFAMMMDTGREVGAFGMRAFLQHIKPYRRILNADGKWVMAHGLDRELEATLGTGTDALRAFHMRTLTDQGDIRALDRNRVVDKVQAVGDMLSTITYHASGSAWVDTQIKLMAGRAAAQRFADLADDVLVKFKGDLTKLKRADLDRLRFIGLSDEDTLRILQQVHDHASRANGFLFGKKLLKLNIDDWRDQEAAALFSDALYKWSRHVVQESDAGQLHRAMSHPLAQTLLQYRRFMMGAWENQLLHGIAHPDGTTALMFAWSMFTGGLVYAVQTQLQALGRSDADEFLQKRLGDPVALSTAIFQRAGFSSLLPMLIDTALVFTPAGPIFNASTSGRPADFIFGNPTYSMIESWRKGTKALISATWDGRELSQQEMRQIQKGIIFQNTMPLAQLFSVLISDRPLKPER